MVTRQIWHQLQHDVWNRFWIMVEVSVFRQSRRVITIPTAHDVRTQIREELKW